MWHFSKTSLLFSFVSLVFSFERGSIVSIQEIDYESHAEIQSNIDNDLGTLSMDVDYGATMFKVVYETVDGFGDSTIASGVFAVPESENEAFGILSWQHGTAIYRDGVQSNGGFDVLARAVAATGTVYVAADYLGMGVSESIHPYILKYPSANAVIDLIRAVRNYFDEDQTISLNRQLSIFGYSEGGYATLAAQMVMEQEMSDEFDITVSFPMAGPYDLSGTMVDKMLDGEPYGEPFYLPFMLYAYINYYEMGSLSDYFIPSFSPQIEGLFSGDYGGGYINSYMNNNGYNPPILCMIPEVVDEFSTDENHILSQLLTENNLYDWAPQSLTYLFHALGDELVPHENSVLAYNSFVENGSENVHLELLPESFGGHAEAAPYAVLSAHYLLADMKLINPKGDVTHDAMVDITDLVLTVNIIMSIVMEVDDYALWAADFNSDTIIDILDLVNMVNYILSQS
ncbi:MAG: prolyl oligopeptidase family serine peptidase [Candidatus Marinimicrobia bacterium]|nr:prolyl oligopeptidase family serine peptidase [Candidatus Neomarinimicrobiota bacterium]